MDIQQHERIARIKQISGYLYVGLTWARYLFWVMCPLIVGVVLFGSNGTLILGDVQTAVTELSVAQRGLLLAVVAVVLFFLLNVIHHFRGLMRYFSAGDIFNEKAIDHARKALHYSLGFFLAHIAGSIAMSAYLYIGAQDFQISLDGNYIFGLLVFGLMFVLLWALEIGRDLNEESELTI